MRRAIALLVAASSAWAHEPSGPRKPSKADADLKIARVRMEEAKKKLAAKGKYACCIRKPCDLCAKRNGSCACALNIAKGKGACGECLAGWKRGEGALKGVKAEDVKLLPSTEQALPGKHEHPPELAEAEAAMNRAKRILVSEKRYSCCIRGGCDECAHEASCPCGADLAAQGPASCARVPKEKQKGVCSHCYDGWHAGHGSLRGVDLSEVQMSDMAAEMDQMMSPGMSTGVAQSGWYASGTAQMPRSSPLYMVHRRTENWLFMGMGQVMTVNTQQTGPRGDDGWFAANYIMPMATRRVGRGYLTIRGMFSFEPASVRGGSYPLLFQSGETYLNRPILDGQHPHDFIMELGASYQLPLSERVSLNFYAGPRGEPALGPVAYPHRLSASENPLAVLAHHYQDSTHIANNVVTVGATIGKFTVEGSGFNGREPDERRWNLERGGIDSFAARLTYNPTRAWSAQFSGGRIEAREPVHPDKASTRLTASVMNVQQTQSGYVATTVLWGQNRDYEDDGHAHVFNSFLAESTWRWRQNWIWGRFESVTVPRTLAFRGSPLLPFIEEEPIGRVQAYTAGYSRELPRLTPWLSTALGSQVTWYQAPDTLERFYNRWPVGVQFFLRVRLAGSHTR